MQRETRETQLLEIDGITIELQRKRVKNINLRIRADGTVHVSAPLRTPQATVEAFVRSKADWIRDRVQLRQEQAEEAPRRWADGEQVFVWGEPAPLVLTEAASVRSEGVRLTDGKLFVAVANRYSGEGDDAVAHRERLVERWQAAQVRDAALPLLEQHGKRMGVQAGSLRLRRMKSRWGSCNVRTGAITLNSELARFPHQCLEQVVVHELCHLLEPSHNARFHALMDRYYPAWPEARRLLRQGLGAV